MRGFFCALFAGIMCLESLCGSQFREDRITDNEPTYAIRYETGKSDLPQELQLYAQGAVLLDADSGRVLYGKNENDPHGYGKYHQDHDLYFGAGKCKGG